MSAIKALVFTHFGRLRHGKDVTEFRDNQGDYLNRYTEIIASCLRCVHEGGQVALVYAYVDWAVRAAVPHIGNEKKRFTIDASLLEREKALVDVLRMAEDKARRRLGLGLDHPPRFHYVGITDLVALLNGLIEVKQELVSFLCGEGGEFTYDSPKFVEAVIRLARGQTPDPCQQPRNSD